MRAGMLEDKHCETHCYYKLPKTWLKILSKLTSSFFSRYLCITLRTLKQEKIIYYTKYTNLNIVIYTTKT